MPERDEYGPPWWLAVIIVLNVAAWLTVIVAGFVWTLRWAEWL